jgi:hypothetical protein
MSSIMKARIRGRLVLTPLAIGAAVAGIGIGTILSVEIGGASSPMAGVTASAVYPVNIHGQTYGSSLGATSLAGEPDLIASVATNGKDGYVFKTDLEAASGGNVTTLQEAAAWDKNGALVSHTVPVYAQDGTTVIGSFFISASHPTQTPAG